MLVVWSLSERKQVVLDLMSSLMSSDCGSAVALLTEGEIQEEGEEVISKYFNYLNVI